MLRKQNPRSSQSFIKLSISCVPATFVFLFYTYTPANLWDVLTPRHLNQCFRPFKDHFSPGPSVGFDFL